MPITKITLSLVACLASVAEVRAGELQVKDIKAYLFYSNSGVLSENIVGGASCKTLGGGRVAKFVRL